MVFKYFNSELLVFKISEAWSIITKSSHENQFRPFLALPGLECNPDKIVWWSWCSDLQDNQNINITCTPLTGSLTATHPKIEYFPTSPHHQSDRVSQSYPALDVSSSVKNQSFLISHTLSMTDILEKFIWNDNKHKRSQSEHSPNVYLLMKH